jgi:hypothetical protein
VSLIGISAGAVGDKNHVRFLKVIDGLLSILLTLPTGPSRRQLIILLAALNLFTDHSIAVETSACAIP